MNNEQFEFMVSIYSSMCQCLLINWCLTQTVAVFQLFKVYCNDRLSGVMVIVW